jgi:DNA-binding winged helix-turn-helix (wHTH) protein
MAAGTRVLYEFGPFRVDPDKQLLLRGDQSVPITSKVFETLLMLLRHSREVVSKDELMKTVWPDAFVEEGNLSQSIFMLRKALGDAPDERQYIVTLPGKGYRFVAQVRTITQDGEDVVIRSRSRSEIIVQQPDSTPMGSRSAPALALLRRVSWRFLIPFAAASVLLSGFFIFRRVHPPVGGARSLIVADFANTTGNEAFDGTLRAGLRLKLTESPYLTIVPEAKLRTSLKDRGGKPVTQILPEVARLVCGKLQANAVLSGAIGPQTQGGYRLQLNVTDCQTGTTIAREDEHASSQDDVLATLGRAADDLRTRLGEPAASVQQFRTPLARASTDRSSQYRFFGRAEVVFHRRTTTRGGTGL